MTKAGKILETAIIFYLQFNFVLFSRFPSFKSSAPKRLHSQIVLITSVQARDLCSDDENLIVEVGRQGAESSLGCVPLFWHTQPRAGFAVEKEHVKPP